MLGDLKFFGYFSQSHAFNQRRPASFPLRGPSNETLSGYAEWDTVEEMEGDRQHFAVWIFRRPAPQGTQAAAPRPRTVPPGPPPQ